MVARLIIASINVGLFFFVGFCFATIITSNKIKYLEEEKNNAEYRGLIHFRKIQAIENIVNECEKHKTPTILMKEKIKEVLFDNK